MSEEKAKTYSIRRYKEGDEIGINSLYHEIFGQSRDLKTWTWKHKENPAGMATIWVAESSKGEIIGNLSITRIKFQLGEKTLLSGQAVDIMVKQEFRKLGKRRVVLDLCSEKNHSVLWRQGFHFLFGFPIKFFYRLTVKMLGYTMVGNVPLMVKPIRLSPLVQAHAGSKIFVPFTRVVDRLLRVVLMKKHQRTGPLNISRVDFFDSRLDELWRDFASSHQPISVVRDSSYLNWRFAWHPNFQYALYVAEERQKVVGYIVLRVRQEGIRRRGYITDILASPGKEKLVLHQLLSTAIVHCLKEGAESVVGWAFPHMPLYAIMKRKRFFAREGEIRLVARDLSGDIASEFLLNPKNWYVAIGDSDGI